MKKISCFCNFLAVNTIDNKHQCLGVREVKLPERPICEP
jgi:hypothetical protein